MQEQKENKWRCRVELEEQLLGRFPPGKFRETIPKKLPYVSTPSVDTSRRHSGHPNCLLRGLEAVNRSVRLGFRSVGTQN